MPDAEQFNAAFWNGAGGHIWVARHRYHPGAGLEGVALAAPRAGERALDIGCGALTLALARTVGPGACVTALDIFAPIPAESQARATPVA